MASSGTKLRAPTAKEQRRTELATAAKTKEKRPRYFEKSAPCSSSGVKYPIGFTRDDLDLLKAHRKATEKMNITTAAGSTSAVMTAAMVQVIKDFDELVASIEEGLTEAEGGGSDTKEVVVTPVMTALVRELGEALESTNEESRKSLDMWRHVDIAKGSVHVERGMKSLGPQLVRTNSRTAHTTHLHASLVDLITPD